MRLLLPIVLVGACERENAVKLSLGSTSDVTTGFTCAEAYGAQALNLGTPRTIYVVVDAIDVGGTLLGCRSEELATGCAGNACKVIDRRCVAITIETPFSLDGIQQAVPAIADELRRDLAAAGTIIPDAPDGPVMIRATAVTRQCITDPNTPLPTSLAVGCAYSCPTILDEVEGSLSLGLDGLIGGDLCASLIKGCAAFPRPLSD